MLSRRYVPCDSTLRERYDTSDMFSRRFSVPLLLVLLSACAIKKPAGPSALETDYQLKMEDANSSFDKGCFVCLTDAFEIYQELLSHPLDRGTAQQKLFQTSLLLALREKELDIQNERYEDEAETWIPDPPSSDSLLALEIVEATSSSSSGFSDERLEEHFKGLRRLREIAGSDKLVSSLKQQADAEWFGAYIYMSLMNALNASKGDDIGPEIDSLAEAHGASPPALYKYAISTGSDRARLENVVQLEPRFYETHFFLGQTALKEGDLYGGEAHLAEAHRHFPDSLTIVTLLAETVLEIGESEKSLEYYEKAL